jgi:hypothetical protein
MDIHEQQRFDLLYEQHLTRKKTGQAQIFRD